MQISMKTMVKASIRS